MNQGKLYLIPTPIDEESPLETVAKKLLQQAYENKQLIVVEEHKAARRRWLHWGLPKEAIEHFELYNEHHQMDEKHPLFLALKAGREVYLMSDGGLPAFCDPGVELVDLCHRHGIAVTSSPFCHAPALAVALSGLKFKNYRFCSLLPRDKEQLQQALQNLAKDHEGSVFIEAPYRVAKILELLKKELQQQKEREVFVAMDLNSPSERLWRGQAFKLEELYKDLKKCEAVIILGPKR